MFRRCIVAPLRRRLITAPFQRHRGQTRRAHIGAMPKGPETRFIMDPGVALERDGDTGDPFGFNGVGRLAAVKSYLRIVTTPGHRREGSYETWADVCERVVNGTLSMRKRWCLGHSFGWNEAQAQVQARSMFDSIYSMRWTPPGRGLWVMGTPAIEERGLMAALNNCGFISTGTQLDGTVRDPINDYEYSQRWTMSMSMVGVGVGLDTRAATQGLIRIVGVDQNAEPIDHVIADSREGWCDALGLGIRSHLRGLPRPRFIYDQVRPAGAAIRGFGGKASGPGPLKDMLEKIDELFEADRGQLLSVKLVVDVVNLIGRCVVSGNVRRSALITLSPPQAEFDAATFGNLKNFDVFPERNHPKTGWGWTSNNSFEAYLGMDYRDAQEKIRLNGEPGFVFLDNMRAYGRMDGQPTWDDADVMGCNPCVTADTIISTTDGPIPVSDLIGVPFIALVDGKEWPVPGGFFPTGDKDVFELELETGETLSLTSNHRVLVTMTPEESPRATISVDFSDMKWVQAGELRMEQDRIVTSAGGASTHGQGKAVRFDALGVQPVFDCTVPILHAFVANGIVVHNCVEQSLANGELCNLVETYPQNHETMEEFVERTLPEANFYGQTVTLGGAGSEWELSNRIMAKNRRLGISMSGIAQFIEARGVHELKTWCEAGYTAIRAANDAGARELGIPRSVKVTSIKPSGTVSLLAGASPGVHYMYSTFYWRRIRMPKGHAMVQSMRAAGVHVEDDITASDRTEIVRLPVDTRGRCGSLDGDVVSRSASDVSMWEQLWLAMFMQKHYADNQVSATIYFDPETEGHQIARAMDYAQYSLKGISFLPKATGTYQQPPYEEITEAEYHAAVAEIDFDAIDWSAMHQVDDFGQAMDPAPERGCDADGCEVEEEPLATVTEEAEKTEKTEKVGATIDTEPEPESKSSPRNVNPWRLATARYAIDSWTAKYFFVLFTVDDCDACGDALRLIEDSGVIPEGGHIRVVNVSGPDRAKLRGQLRTVLDRKLTLPLAFSWGTLIGGPKEIEAWTESRVNGAE